MPEEVLDIQLAGVVGDRPGGESVPEAVGMDPWDSRGFAQPPQELLESVGPEPHAGMEPPVAGGEEERTRGRTSVGKIDREASAQRPAKGTRRSLPPLPRRTSRRRSGSRQSARSKWAASEQRTPG